MISRPILWRLVALAGLIAILVIVTLRAPEEATLGTNMRWVYLHVAFTWAGTSIINLAALAGVYFIFRPNSIRHSLWVAPTQGAGIALFGIGFALSLAASWTSWGGILWMEPRVLSSMGILAGGLIVVLLVTLAVSPRIIGILAILLSVGVSFTLASTSRVFHPDDPIDASDSTNIRLTFYALTVVAVAIGLVLAMIFKGSPKKPSAMPGVG